MILSKLRLSTISSLGRLLAVPRSGVLDSNVARLIVQGGQRDANTVPRAGLFGTGTSKRASGIRGSRTRQPQIDRFSRPGARNAGRRTRGGILRNGDASPRPRGARRRSCRWNLTRERGQLFPVAPARCSSRYREWRTAQPTADLTIWGDPS